MSLRGKKILITGGAGYLGSAICQQILSNGGELVVVGQRAEPEELLPLKTQFPDRLTYFTGDVSTQAGIDAIVEQIDGVMHGIVSNAYGGGGGTIETSSDHEMYQAFNINLMAAHRLIRGLLPHLRKARVQNEGVSIVNVASMYGMVSPDPTIYPDKSAVNPPFYGVSKAGLIQYSRYAAAEFGAEGIRVNSVSFGPFPNPARNKDEGFLAKLADKTMLRRIGQANEAGGPVAFLLSDAASYITGSNIVIDGGWTAW